MKQIKNLSIAILLVTHLGAFAQADTIPTANKVFTDQEGYRFIAAEPSTPPSTLPAAAPSSGLDKDAQFPGGEQAMQSFIERTMKYNLASEEDEGNAVTLGFTVTSTGFRTQMKVLKNVSYACDKEAVRVLDAMPLWEPAVRNGKAVSMDYVLDIVFDRKDKSQSDYIYTTADSAPRAPQAVDNFAIANTEKVVVVDKPPHFPDGDYAMWQFIDLNMDVNLLEKDASGDEVVSFDVTETGQIVNVLIDKTLGAEYDKEAVRLVKSMPRWVPGIKNGKPAKMTYYLAIPF